MNTATLNRPHHSGALARQERHGLWMGLIGVVIFSLTLPFTRLAVAELDPVFVALGRAVVAAACAGIWLVATRAPRPTRAQVKRLGIVAAGVVVGFPLLSSIAMRHIPAVHGAIVTGILPLATAVCAIFIGRERPSIGFWICAVVGSALVVLFALRAGGGSLQRGDWAMLVAIGAAAIGYAEGGRMSQNMGGTWVISWALVLAAPLLLPLVGIVAWLDAPRIAAASLPAWLGMAYVSLFSMFIGFIFWYRGLALGGVARVGQVQLLQPFFSLIGAALIVHEALQVETIGFALAVIVVVALGRRFAVARPAPVLIAEAA